MSRRMDQRARQQPPGGLKAARAAGAAPPPQQHVRVQMAQEVYLFKLAIGLARGPDVSAQVERCRATCQLAADEGLNPHPADQLDLDIMETLHECQTKLRPLLVRANEVSAQMQQQEAEAAGLAAQAAGAPRHTCWLWCPCRQGEEARQAFVLLTGKEWGGEVLQKEAEGHVALADANAAAQREADARVGIALPVPPPAGSVVLVSAPAPSGPDAPSRLIVP